MAKNSKYNSYNLVANGMGIPPHDYLINTWTNNKLVRTTYKLGGALGEIVAIIDMVYDGDNLLTAERVA